MRSSRFQVPGFKKYAGSKFLGVLAALVLLAQPASVLACAACYGASDSPMAKGMNWGIFSLMGVIGTVLGCIATFFVFIGKKSAEASSLPDADSQNKTEPTDKA
jgi:drug/metabolite transporter (DMT)-like permease